MRGLTSIPLWKCCHRAQARPATVLQRPQALVAGAPTTRQPRCGRREKTFSQKMAEAEQLEAIERARARERSIANLKRGDQKPEMETLPPREGGKTRDKVAAATGIGSGRTYDKAAKVWEADEGATESHQTHKKGPRSDANLVRVICTLRLRCGP